MNTLPVKSLAFALAIVAAAPAQSIRTLSQGKAMREQFVSVVARANKSTVEVAVDDVSMVLGTVVAKDLVLTKYSELRRKLREKESKGKISILQLDQEWQCEQVGFDRPSDLVLLRVKNARLTPIEWQLEVPKPGAFLATPDTNRLPLGVGILAAAPYRYTRQRAFLGIQFKQPEGPSVELELVVEHGAAQAAGLQKGDVIVGFEDHEVAVPDDLRGYLRRSKPGDEVKIDVMRGDQKMSFDVKLGTNTSPMPSDQDQIWGPLSEVRSGFEEILQHDTVMEPGDCGGPIVDLSGKAVGINLARAGRVETLAMPAKAVQALVKKLQNGNKAEAK